jgi:hypothetical protein
MSDESNSDQSHEEGKYALLLDSAYPLLQQFRDTCPGTYKHAQALMTMIEGISLDLGLDVNLMKVAALYHDIGKMLNPKYFTENQLEDEDLHADLDSKISYELITRHVSDTVMKLINDKNFSRKVISIISQHHGKTVVKYFHKKAGGRKKDEKLYRYHCSKPHSVEAMVLMVCDHVEATSRSLSQAGKLDLGKVIDATINGLINDGQLDEVTVRLGDLKKIKESLAKELEGTYQKRVDYDKVEEEAPADD